MDRDPGDGGDQRVYPWSVAYPPGSTTISCTDANYSGCPAGAPSAVGGEAAGIGKWGQSDLAGNVWEWTLDTWDLSSSYVDPCADCAHLAPATSRTSRGGSFNANDPTLSALASFRGGGNPRARGAVTGFRCARSP